MPAGVDPKQAYAVIWTTTPWTMPANVAISVNPELEYGWVKAGDEYYLMATELVDAAMKDIGIEDYEIVNRFSGADLELAEFKHPFVERTSTVLCGDHVTLEAGTGCVHTLLHTVKTTLTSLCVITRKVKLSFLSFPLLTKLVTILNK